MKRSAIVCETVPVAGSHFPRRICQTVRERELARQQLQNQLGAQNPSGYTRGGN